MFLRFFQNPKSRDFLRFFAVFRTFSRTVCSETGQTVEHRVAIVKGWLREWWQTDRQTDRYRCRSHCVGRALNNLGTTTLASLCQNHDARDTVYEIARWASAGVINKSDNRGRQTVGVAWTRQSEHMRDGNKRAKWDCDYTQKTLYWLTEPARTTAERL